MKHNLLSKLAYNGLKNNRKTIFPFIFVSAITVMVFYILLSLSDSKFIMRGGEAAFYGANEIVLFLQIGCIAIGIFATIFLFYANRFIMKGQKKEIGLYGVLGLSKKNVTIVLLIESFIQSVLSIGFGILGGAFLNKLMLLFLYKLIHQPFVKGMDFSVKATVITIGFFSFLFIVLFFFNLFEVRLGNPIALLRSENVGEEEPKVKWLYFVLGIAMLIYGYYTAVSTQNTFAAMGNIVKAIVLVTIATYALFVSGSIFVLKMLKRNKKYFYQTKHFISVSNLMFRMKHNAVGLSSICILSTAVILLLVCTFSLLMLGEQNIDAMFKRDIVVWGLETENTSMDYCMNAMNEAISEGNIQATDKIYRRFHMEVCNEVNGGLESFSMPSFDFTKMKVLYIITADDYNRYTGENETLQKGEILRYSKNKLKQGDLFSVFGSDFMVKKQIGKECLEAAFDPTMRLFDQEIIVVSDEEEKKALIECNPEHVDTDDKIYMGFDVPEKLSTNQLAALQSVFTQRLGEIDFSYKEEERTAFYSIYGGTFFVGIFLAIIFLVATVIIIFYKQMSEGMEDKKRFEILSNAGLSGKEASDTIKSQVRIMFFLPAGTAIIHMLFASKILRLFMGMILNVDTLTFNGAIAMVSILFLGTYAIIYRITSGQYYEIVYGKEGVK